MNQPYAGGTPYGQLALSPIEAWNKRVKLFGTVVLVCAAAYLFLLLSHLAFRAITVPLLRMYFAWLETMTPGISLSRMIEPLQAFQDRMLIWEIVVGVPFVACTVWLVFIGRRLRRCDRAALATVRFWTMADGACVVLSLLVQVLVTLPATSAYTAELMRVMPSRSTGRGAPPFDIQGMVSSMTSAATGMGVILGALFAAAFPIALYLWAQKLERETPA